jgi:hypothetical protein
MTQIISVSMKEEQYKFMKESKLSPSRVLQDALIYLDTENVTSMLKHNKEIRQAQKRLIQFVQEKGLSEDYSKYVLEQKD